jgi:hypothetical protein
VIAGSTARAVELFGAPEAQASGFMWAVLVQGMSGAPIVVVVGVFLVALLLQSDSSARSDAFWVTRPLAPSAVLGAKLALAGVLLLLLPLAGQVAAFVVHDVPVERIVPLAVESVSTMSAILAVVAVFAALTPDLRTLLSAFLITVVCWAFARLPLVAFDEAEVRWAGFVSRLVPSLFLTATGLALVAFQYRARDVRRTLRVFALPAIVSATLLAMPRRYDAPASNEPPPPALHMDRLQVVARDLTLGDGPTLSAWQVRLEIELAEDAVDRHRYVLSEGVVTFGLPDGSAEKRSLRGSGTRDVALNPTNVDVPGFTWMGPGELPSRWPWHSAWVAIPERVAWALREGGVSVEVEGRIRVSKPLELARVPLRVGASFTRDGSRLRIDEVHEGPDGPTLSTSTETIASWGDRWESDLLDRWDVVALNPPRKEALALRITSSGSGVSHQLILPGPSARALHAVLGRLVTYPPPDQRVDWTTWMRDAELSITDWVPIGSYPIHVVVEDVKLER